MQISPKDHLAVQAACQKWIDASISKTINCPKDISYEDFKDIYDIVIVDGASSVKLVYVPAREFDRVIPYPEIYTEGKPRWYVDYRENYDLYRIPDDTYPIRIRCSLYPTEFSSASQTSDLLHKDQVIIAAATWFCLLDLA
jgi:hypothetical protein